MQNGSNTRAEQRLKWQSGAVLIIIVFFPSLLISSFKAPVWDNEGVDQEAGEDK